MRKQHAPGSQIQLEAAVAALQNGTEPSLRKAAAAHGVSKTTLAMRVNGYRDRRAAHEKQMLLTVQQEETLVNWIRTLEAQSFALRHDLLRQMVLTLIGGRVPRAPGKKWITRFCARHDLVTVFSRRLDCNRAWNNDPVIITEWFQF